MPATSLRECAALVTATRAAGGEPPKILTDILAGADLLNGRRGSSDPAHPIVKAAAAGELTAELLDQLAIEAAHAQLVNTYVGELRQRSEKMFIDEFHRALQAGACDQLLNTLRPIWNEHSAAVDEARGQINPESSAEHILEMGDATLAACWQQLPGHLAKLNQICAVARQFGPRAGAFPMIKEYANSDNFRLEDSAIFCANGNSLEVDSGAFRRPGVHRNSPLFAVALRLNTLEQATERYRAWACQQWESTHAGMQQYYLVDGKRVPVPQQPNPYAEERDAG